MARNKNDALTTCKVASFEVTGEYDAETWHDIAQDCRGLANAFWQCWNAWHYNNGSFWKLQEWLNARTADKKKAGKCPVEAIPKELEPELHQLRWRFPRIPSRISTLLPQRLKQTLKNRKAAKGNLPGYSAIILGHEGFQRFNNPYPLLFDRDNATFEPPAERDGNWAIRIRLERQPGVDGEMGSEVEHRLELWCTGRKVRSQVEILRRIVDGDRTLRDGIAAIDRGYQPRLKKLKKGSDDFKALNKERLAKINTLRASVKATGYSFAGSQLVYSQSKRKWFVKLCYQLPETAEASPNAKNTAVLRAREDGPWELVFPDGTVRRPGGDGRFVGRFRRDLMTERWSRRAHYRHAGSAAKGHGRERAGAGPQFKLRERWLNLVKRTNSNVCNQVLQACVQNDCGALTYEQPVGKFASTRFLSTTGHVQKECYHCQGTGTREEKPCKDCGGKGFVIRNDGSSWEYFQLATMLQQRCAKSGVVVNVVKVDGLDDGEGSGDAKNPGSPRSDRSGGGNKSSGNEQKPKAAEKPKGQGRNKDRSKSSAKPKRDKRVRKRAVARDGKSIR